MREIEDSTKSNFEQLGTSYNITIMMKKHSKIKRFLILTFLFIVLLGAVSATGPSYINSEIKPISINENGEILCRTRFSKNEMGAQRAMKITYGYLVITKDSIIQFSTQEIEPDGFPDYKTFSKLVRYWDSIFNSCYDNDKLSEIAHGIKNQYQFDLCNVSKYKINKVQKIFDFESKKQIDLTYTNQLALNGAKSTDYFDNKNLHIMYDFGNVVIMNNINNEYEETQIGADFDYFNPWTNDNGDVENIGFEITRISGILRTN